MSSSTKDEIELGQGPSSSETSANKSSSPHINLVATASIDQEIEQDVHKQQDKTSDVDDNHDLPQRSDEEGHRQILEEGGEHSNNDISLRSGGPMGSLSPTSSSSLSSQGSSNAGTNVSLSSEPLAEKMPSSPAAIAVNGEQRSHHITSKNSTRSSHEDNAPSPSKNLEPSSTTANSPQSKGSSSKSRPRSSQGRPRSNSVPFDFHSENESSKYKTSSSSKPGHSLRRGKWTVEEESYVARVIQDFNSGYLNAPPGTTLRTYLSDKLNCDPMRITKKFTGDSCIGKRVFHPAVRCSKNSALIDKAQSELDILERRWRKRLEMQQKEAAKKQAAASTAAAALSGRMFHGKSIHESLGNKGNRAVVTQTASWLDRANAILAQSHSSQRSETETKISKTSSDEVEEEMKEVERLIHEGPMIQKTSAGLSTILQQDSSRHDSAPSSDFPSKRKVSDDDKSIPGGNLGTPDHSPSLQQSFSAEGKISFQPRFYDKRMKRSYSHNHLQNIQDHEDAATLMGFLSSVHQAASKSASLNEL